MVFINLLCKSEEVMDILNILKTQGKKLYKEELEFFITELEIGDYSPDYVKQCKSLINNLLKPKKVDLEFDEKENKIISSKITLSYDQLTNKSNLFMASPEDVFIKDINFMRDKKEYKDNFYDYIKMKKDILTVSFVEENLTFFTEWEIANLLSVVELPEEFLEKYFSILDKKAIAKYQKFSESFFMKHYNELPTTTVLKTGVNEWRKKINRSSKLDVFLRLKGVTY